MKFYALIEEWSDESLVFFRELPGCFSFASTTEEALQKAPEAIRAYIQWLKQHTIFFLEEEVTSIEVVVRERLSECRVGPCFEAERTAPTDQEIAHALAVATTARAQIAELYDRALPAQRSRASKAGEWSLTDHLQHVVSSEAYYVGCLHDQQPEALPSLSEDELSMRLLENARNYETFLHGLSLEQRTRVYIHGEAEWTAAKVLRRMTEHLRDHSFAMQALMDQLSS